MRIEKLVALWLAMMSVLVALVVPFALPAQGAGGFPLAPSDGRIQAALDFLRNSETAHPQIWTNPEKICYAIVAVEACGADAHSFKNARGQSLVDIIREHAATSLPPQRSASLVHEAYLFAIVAAGEDPHNFGGVNVIQQLEEMFDGTQIGMPGIINDDFWGVITLVGAGEDPNSSLIQTVKGHILANQSPDGGWGSVAGGSGSDPCDTANAITALRAAGESPASAAIQRALGYLKASQSADGGFPYMIGYPSDTGSDARVIAALTACGIDPTSAEWSVNGQNAVTHALSLQQPDGGFAWHSGGATDAWMTTYILPALVGKHWPPDLFVGKTPPPTPSSSPAPTGETNPSLPPDSTPPAIGAVSPSPQETVPTGRPTISASYSDSGSGIALASIVLKVDGAEVTASATVTASGITYTPASSLRNGTHTVELIVFDKSGNRARKSWNFNVSDPSVTPPTPSPQPAASGGAIKPIIIVLTPEPQQTVHTPFPTITAAYSAPASAIDPEGIVLKVDSVDVTQGATVTETHLTYTPERGLSPGTHTVEITVRDRNGSRARRAWNFNVATELASGTDLSTKMDISGTLTRSAALSLCEGMVQIEIPEGTRALDAIGEPLARLDARRASDQPSPPEQFRPVGPVYLLEPEGASFDPPVTLSLSYSERAAGERPAWDVDGNGTVDAMDLIRIGTSPWEGVREENFKIAYYDRQTGAWVILNESRPDPVGNTVTTKIDRLRPVVIVGSGEPQNFPTDETAALPTEALRSADERAELFFEEGTALKGTPPDHLRMALWENPAPSPQGLCRIGPGYLIEPEDAQPVPTPTLTLRYDEAILSGGIRWDTTGDGRLDLLDDEIATAPEDFRIARFDPTKGEWEFLPSTVDRRAQTVTAPIERFGRYAILGPATLPLAVHRIEPLPAEIGPGEPMTFRLHVENPGSARGTYLIAVAVDGVTEHEREVTLSPGRHVIEIQHEEPYTGTHSVEVSGVRAEFSVREISSGPGTFPMVIGGAVGGGAAIAGLALFGWRIRRTNRGERR